MLAAADPVAPPAFPGDYLDVTAADQDGNPGGEPAFLWIAPLVNAYLLRFYFQIRGMPEAEFMARLHALQERKESAHG